MAAMTGALVLVALGGAAGSVARHLVTGLAERLAGNRLPWGTLAVNISGAAAAGALAPILLREGGPPSLWLALGVGGLGSFTTVSGFVLEIRGLVAEGRRRAAGIYTLLSLSLGLAGAAAGWGWAAG